MPNYIDDDTALPATRVDRRPIPPGESETKFVDADFCNALLQFDEDARDAIQALQSGGGGSFPSITDDGSTVTIAGTTAVQGLRGKKQTVTSTGLLSVTLAATTSIVEFNAASQVDLVGMSGGSADRLVLFRNKGVGNVFVYAENGNEATAANRFDLDEFSGATGSLLVNGGGMGLAMYDSDASRWVYAALLGKNTPGPTMISGTLATSGNVGFNGTAPIAKPTVTGSRGGNAALASLLTALANYGLITDGTS